MILTKQSSADQNETGKMYILIITAGRIGRILSENKIQCLGVEEYCHILFLNNELPF